MDKKKKIAIAVSVCTAVVVIVAVAITAVYAIPFLKLGEAFKKPSEQPDTLTTEEAGSFIEETVTDTDGNTVTEANGAPVTVTRENNTASQGSTQNASSAGNDKTTEGHSGDKKPDASTTGKPGTTSSGQTTKPSSTPVGSTAASSTTAPSQTTKPAAPQPGTTNPVPPSTSAPVTAPPTTAAAQKSEYDIYRSGRFYAKGSAIDGDGTVTPLELAVTDKTVYMISQVDGVNIGILMNGKKSYMMYEDKKKYCELNSVLMNAADLDPEEMINTAKESYADLETLDNAVRLAEEYVNGYPCKTYHFRNDEHELTTVSISGNKLVQVANYDKNGRMETTINFTSVSADVPQSKIEPPKDYKKVGMVSFLMELSSAMGVDLDE